MSFIKLTFISLLVLFSACTKKSEKSTSAPETQGAVCEDKKLVYKTCTEQDVIFAQAEEQAKKAGKPLLVKFGFENCPWCLALHKSFKEGGLKDFVSEQFVVAEINIIPDSGKKVFEKIKGSYAKKSNETGFPFLIVYDPQKKKSVHQDTGDLEDNSNGKGHNLQKVKLALSNAVKKLKSL